MTSFVFEAADERDTDRLGRALAEALPDGTTVALVGTLGSGKTRLVKAAAAACGLDPRDVISPTFVLAQHYHGRRTLNHFDVYRLGGGDEFVELGPEEYFAGPGLTFVEWAERVSESLPDDRIEIAIEPVGETQRRFKISGLGPRAAVAVNQLRQSLNN